MPAQPQGGDDRAQEMSADEAVRRFNEWGGKPLPLSATCWYRGRPSARCPAPRVPWPRGAAHRWRSRCATRERSGPMCASSARSRSSRDRDAASMACFGAFDRTAGRSRRRAADRMGRRAALAALRATYRKTASRCATGRGGTAAMRRCFVATDKSAGVFQPLPAAVLDLHQRLKAAFDPAGIFNPRPHVRGVLNDGNASRRLHQGHARGPRGGSDPARCVHCGFCTATCPTYQLLGDELDGPRGRIYLIKQMLEGADGHREHAVAPRPLPDLPQLRDDLPVGCALRTPRRYRAPVVEQNSRPPSRRERAHALAAAQGRSRIGALFASALAAGRFVQPFLPTRAGAKRAPLATRRRRGRRAPRASDARADGLRAAGAGAVDRCGDGASARPHRHFARRATGSRLLRRAQPPSRRARRGAAFDPPQHRCVVAALERGAEAILVTASGCGVVVKDYGDLLRDDPAYADKARARRGACARPGRSHRRGMETPRAVCGDGSRSAACCVPLAVHIAARTAARRQGRGDSRGHRARIDAGRRRASVLRLRGHLLDPAAANLSQQLRANKLRALEAGRPGVIVTANIGCLTHLACGTRPGVRHWIELLDARLRRARLIVDRARRNDPPSIYRHFLSRPAGWTTTLRPRQQRRLLLVLRYGGERAPDSRRRARHSRRRRRSASCRDFLPLSSAAFFPGRRRRRAAGREARELIGDATRSACSGRATTIPQRPATSFTSGSIVRRDRPTPVPAAVRTALQALVWFHPAPS